MFARQTVYETLLLAALVTALTFAAAWVYPIWDDGRLMLAIRNSAAMRSGQISATVHSLPYSTFFYSSIIYSSRSASLCTGRDAQHGIGYQTFLARDFSGSSRVWSASGAPVRGADFVQDANGLIDHGHD
jgi:hypothetical protein